ncbi:MAG: NAD-dependent epimerase/dehydratase family protein [Candidatus Rokuibacteriota bacterium]
MSRVLVLGGAGFIGYHLARHLGDEGVHTVTLVDDLSRGRLDEDLSALLERPGIALVRADLTDPGAWARLAPAWDQVYMLVAVVGVRNVEADPARVITVNTRAVLNLIEWLTPAAGTVFFASTSEAYAGAVNGTLPIPTPEDVPLSVSAIENPRFAYAASKILGEAAVIHGARARRVPYVIGRFHNVYGPRMGFDHVVPELSMRAIARENPFRVYGLEQRRAFCHVADAVEAMTRLMAAPAAEGRIVHIGNDAEETSIERLVQVVLRAAGHTPTLRSLPAPSGSPARRCPDISRLRALTGFAPKIDLESGVRQTFEWYRDHSGARGSRR